MTRMNQVINIHIIKALSFKVLIINFFIQWKLLDLPSHFMTRMTFLNYFNLPFFYWNYYFFQIYEKVVFEEIKKWKKLRFLKLILKFVKIKFRKNIFKIVLKKHVFLFFQLFDSLFDLKYFSNTIKYTYIIFRYQCSFLKVHFFKPNNFFQIE